MSIKVTIRNYNFPITFSHKGWSVKLSKRIGLFKDIAVEAYFEPQTAYQSLKFVRNTIHSLLENGTLKVSQRDFNKYVSLSDSFCNRFKYPSASSKNFSANGGLWDRFLGQNISATEKLVNKVVEYMDINLPQIPSLNTFEYINYLRENGINPSIYAIIVKFSGLCC